MKLRRVALLLAAAVGLSFLSGASGHRNAWPVDWFLIAVATVAREGYFVKAVLTGAAAGLLEDVSQPMLGFNAFAKSALGYGLALVAVRVVLGGPIAVGATLALASLANDAIVAVLASLLMQTPIVLLSKDSIWRAVSTGITAGALEAAATFPWRDWWEKRRLRRLR